MQVREQESQCTLAFTSTDSHVQRENTFWIADWSGASIAECCYISPRDHSGKWKENKPKTSVYVSRTVMHWMDNNRAFGLVVWFSLWVREVPSSILGMPPWTFCWWLCYNKTETCMTKEGSFFYLSVDSFGIQSNHNTNKIISNRTRESFQMINVNSQLKILG